MDGFPLFFYWYCSIRATCDDVLKNARARDFTCKGNFATLPIRTDQSQKTKRMANRVSHLSAARSKLKIFSVLFCTQREARVFHENLCTLASRWMDACGYITISTNVALRVAAAVAKPCATQCMCGQRSMRSADLFLFSPYFYPLPTEWNIEFFPSLCLGFCVLLLLVSLSTVVVAFAVVVPFLLLLLFLSLIYPTSSFDVFICFCLFFGWSSVVVQPPKFFSLFEIFLLLLDVGRFS